MEHRIKDYEEYCRLREHFFSSRGLELYNAFLSNRMAYYTFETNYFALKDYVAQHLPLRVAGKLGDWQNKEPLHNYLLEVTRLIHNYLAAAKTLVDNTRFFVKRHFGQSTTAAAEYHAEVVRRFAHSPIVCFTQELRSYFTHAHLPFISSVMGGSKAMGRDIFTLKLIAKKFDPDWQWKACSRKYIEAHGGEIDIELWNIEYRTLVLEFYHWLQDRIPGWGGADWSEMLDLWDRLGAYDLADEEDLQRRMELQKAEQANRTDQGQR